MTSFPPRPLTSCCPIRQPVLANPRKSLIGKALAWRAGASAQLAGGNTVSWHLYANSHRASNWTILPIVSDLGALTSGTGSVYLLVLSL